MLVAAMGVVSLASAAGPGMEHAVGVPQHNKRVVYPYQASHGYDEVVWKLGLADERCNAHLGPIAQGRLLNRD